MRKLLTTCNQKAGFWWQSLALLGVILLSILALDTLAATPASGTIISNWASASYVTDGTIQTAASNSVEVVVQPQEALLLVEDRTKTSVPNAPIPDLPHRLTNIGTAPVICHIEPTNLTGDNLDVVGLHLHHDLNGNGIADADDPLITPTDNINLAPGKFIDLVVQGSIPNLTKSAALTGIYAKIELSATTTKGLRVTNTDTIEVNGDSNLAITKSASTTTPSAGQIVTFDLSVTNTGMFDAVPIQVTVDGAPRPFVLVRDNIPAKTSFVAFQTTGSAVPLYHLSGNAEYSFSSSAPSDFTNVDAVGFGFATVPAGFNAIVSFDVKIDSDANGSAVNIGHVVSEQQGGGDKVVPSNPVQLTITGGGGGSTQYPDLIVVKAQTTPGSFAINNQYSYTIKVSNIGAADTKGTIQVKDNLPDLLQYVASGSGGNGWTCTAANQVVTCDYTAVIKSKQSAPAFTIVVTTVKVGKATNTAEVSGGNEPSAATHNNTSSVDLEVAAPDLTVTKTQTVPGNVAFSSQYSYTITVHNIGGSDSQGMVQVTDTLPELLQFVAAGSGGNGWQCQAAGQTVTCQYANTITANSDTPPLIIVVTAIAIGKDNNVAVVSGGNEPPAATHNNTSSIPVKVVFPDLIIGKKQTIGGKFTVGNKYSYTLTVSNTGDSDTSGKLTVTDTLPAKLRFVSGSSADATWQCSAVAQLVTCSSDTVVPAHQPSSPIIVVIEATAEGTVTNVATVSGGPEPEIATHNNDSDTITTIIQPAATISGKAWLDVDHDNRYDPGEPELAGFTVQLLCSKSNVTPIGGCDAKVSASSISKLWATATSAFPNARTNVAATDDADPYTVIATTTTDQNGNYIITDVVPGNGYALRFRYPTTGDPVIGTPIIGEGDIPMSTGTVENGLIVGLDIKPQDNVIQQSLPLQPTGIVYDSVTRKPIAGATVTIKGPPGKGFDPQTQTVDRQDTFVTDSSGYYQFLLLSNAPAGSYTITVTPLRIRHRFPSTLIPAAGVLSHPARDCINAHCVQSQTSIPTTSDLNLLHYYLTLDLDPAIDPQIINNHIPLDPVSSVTKPGALTVDKTAAHKEVELGDFLDYSLTIKNTSEDGDLSTVKLRDQLPFDFVYVPGTARLNKQHLAYEPTSRTLPIFDIGTIPAKQAVFLTYRVRTGPGSQQGTGINYAQAYSGVIKSNIAQAKVKILEGVFTEDAFTIGKVFLDCNRNRVQNHGEPGLPGVRLVLETGVSVTTDSEGKYSLYGLNPRTHVLRLDTSTLPVGARLQIMSSRNAGNPESLFLDLSKGELHKANFAIKGCAKPLLAEVQKRKQQLEAGTETAPDETDRTLKTNLTPTATNPIISDTRSLPASGAIGATNNTQPILHQGFSEVMPESEPIAPLAASTPQPPVAKVAHAPIESLLPTLDNHLGFVILKDHDTLPYAQANVVIKGNAGGKLQLTVNGELVSERQVGKKMLITDRQLAAWEYIGVNLVPGNNKLVATQIDPFGNTRDSVIITVKAPDQLGIIKIAVADTQYADGKTPVQVVVNLTDHEGVPVTVRTPLTLESELGSWQVKDLNPDEPGVQVFMEGGRSEYLLIPPKLPGKTKLRISSGILAAEKQITFLEPMRSMMAVGVVEGALHLSDLDMKRVKPARKRDGFEDEISQFAFGDDSKTSGGARSALYLKGKVKGSYLLTLAYDSEKKTADRLFRDIQPDEYYPVYGDSSVRGFDAQSNSRLYVRVDKGRSSVLYGDFTTQSDSEARSVSQYNRSLTGIKHHFENRWLRTNTFASKDSALQVVHEFPADGTSGPFFLPFANSMVLNSEQVEVITRSRNQVSVAIKTESKQRYVDYSIDTFTGRLLFFAPVPSRDSDLNPIFIRVTYEVDAGGAKFWIYGSDAQARVAEWLELGGVAIRDENLQNHSTLLGFNSTLRLAKKTFVTTEVARTDTLLSRSGYGERVELRHETESVQARVYGGHTDSNFDNPSASLTKGRVESAGKLTYRLAPSWNLNSEFLYTADSATSGNRSGEMLSVEHTLKSNVRLEAGVRHSQETATAAGPSVGRQVSDPIDSLRFKATTPIPGYPDAQIYSELEQDVHSGDRRMLAIGGDYQFSSRGRFYARHEVIAGMSGVYALNTDSKYNRSTIAGLETDYMKNGQLFSEYRGADAFGGYAPEAAIGLRNQFTLSTGLRLNTSIERVQSLGKTSSTTLSSPSPALGSGLTTSTTTTTQANSISDESTAVTAGVEYTANRHWKGSARVEVREGQTSNSLLNTLGLAIKLSRDWTFLGRSVFSYTDNFQGDDTDQRRIQLGFAYRDTDEDFWHLLGRYEYRLDRSGSTLSSATSGTTTTNITSLSSGPSNRRVDIVSFHASYQPIRSVVLSERYAFKYVQDDTNGIMSTGYGHLFGTRATVDIGGRWDVGIQGYLLKDAMALDQYGLGADLGYRVAKDLWFALGYNLFGFRDRDFNDVGDTDKGIYMQLRYKFDESDLGPSSWWE